jgi:hypothetical protein
MCYTRTRWVQGRGSNELLDPRDRESMFREHVGAMLEAATEAFLDLLDERLKVQHACASLYTYTYMCVWRYVYVYVCGDISSHISLRKCSLMPLLVRMCHPSGARTICNPLWCPYGVQARLRSCGD